MQERYEVLKAMHTLARMLNDEEFYYGIWAYIIPDDATDEELMEIAADDPDTFHEAVHAFNESYSSYATKSGLYVDGGVHI